MTKKEKPQKTLEERSNEVENLMNQFLDLGISIEHPNTQEFIKIAKQFKEIGQSMSGTLKFPEYERKMIYLFSCQPHIQSNINFKFTGETKPKITLERR